MFKKHTDFIHLTGSQSNLGIMAYTYNFSTWRKKRQEDYEIQDSLDNVGPYSQNRSKQTNKKNFKLRQMNKRFMMINYKIGK